MSGTLDYHGPFLLTTLVFIMLLNLIPSAPCEPCDKIFSNFQIILPAPGADCSSVAKINTDKFRADYKSKYDAKHPVEVFHIGDIVL